MNSVSERTFIYSALLVLCALIGAGAGFSAGLWSFLQIILVVELIYWIGFAGDKSVH